MVELKGIKKNYYNSKGPGGIVEALRGIDLKIERGEMISIEGTSGAGKSTLLHILGCLDKADEGEYILNGKRVVNADEKEMARIRNREIGLVFQQFELIEDESALENAAVPMYIANKTDKEIETRAVYLFNELGIENLLLREVKLMSGGQKQRVAIARALMNDPEIILADEPTGALDSNTSKEIMEMLRSLKEKENKTIIIVTHDPIVSGYCERVVKIEDGWIIQ